MAVTARGVAARLGAPVACGLVALLGLAAPTALADVTLTGGPAPTGLAADADRGVYWTTSAQGGAVQAVDRSGAVQGSVQLPSGTADVQALSYREGRLWIGDIGDAGRKRTSITALRLGSLGYGSTANPRRYELRYTDGAHDAGAMAVSARGRLYLATRGTSPGIYRTDGQPVAGGTNRLVRVAAAPAGVTDMSFSADGNRLLLRTGSGVYVLDPFDDYRTVASGPLGTVAAGEAFTNELGGSALLASDGGDPAGLRRVPLPTTVAPVPTPTPTSSPSPSRTSPTGAIEGVVGPHDRGTMASLVAAGVISLLAAVVVAVKR